MKKHSAKLELDLQVACDNQHLPSAAHFREWVLTALPADRQDAELTIRLVDEAESAELNAQYRGKSGPTNVLSFPADLPTELNLPLLGDLLICKQVVEREAIQQAKALPDHWAHMVIHGTLHLLGYDHINDDDAEVMESLEIELLQQLHISNPYTPQCEDSTQNHE
jgi:probable rRNA maturation factor